MNNGNIKVLWEQINCEACWGKDDINVCYKCECQCRQFQALKVIIEELHHSEEKEKLKQALIDISNLVKKDSIEIDGKYTEVCCSGDDILQTIDKVLGGIK